MKDKMLRYTVNYA